MRIEPLNFGNYSQELLRLARVKLRPERMMKRRLVQAKKRLGRELRNPF